MDSDFDKSYFSTAKMAKKLEVRWFFQAKKDAAYMKPCHDMPFKRRNLSYIMKATNAHHTLSRKRKRSRKCTPERSPSKSKKKPDLLFQCFKYRVKDYNEAFLQSPRPKTRARRATNGSCNDNTNNNDDTDPPLAIPMSLTMTSHSKGPNCVILEEDDICVGGAVVSLSTGELEHDFDQDERRSPSPAHMSNLWCSEEDSMPVARKNDGRGMVVLEPIKFHSDPEDKIIEVHPKTRMVFHFLHFDANGLPAAFTETSSEESLFGNRRCPFCYFDGGSDSGILMHCVLCHGQQLTFEAARSEDGTLHVAVRRKLANQDAMEDDSRDFVFNRRGTDAPTIASVPIVRRQARKAATLDIQTRKKKLRLLQELGAKPSIMQAFVPNDMVPLRQYFHSRTNEPMLDGEWCFDSDDEPDDDWIHQMAEELLDDFVEDDVSLDEKRFMKLWNRFIKSHTLLADSIIPQKCMDFIESHIVELVTWNLRRDLLLHLFNFWDSGLIPSARVIACVKLFDTMAKTVSLANDAPATADGKQNTLE